MSGTGHTLARNGSLYVSPVLEEPQPPNVTRLVSSYIVHRSSFSQVAHRSSLIALPLLLDGRPPDYGGSPCPLYSTCPGPRSCGRHSAGHSIRSCRCNSQRSGPMLGPRSGLRYSYPNSTRFRHCTCTQTRTRSSYRNGYRPCCRNGFRACVRNSVCSRPRNSVRSGPRSRTRNSRRSCSCNGIQPCARPLLAAPSRPRVRNRLLRHRDQESLPKSEL